jgi:hypothetical protein
MPTFAADQLANPGIAGPLPFAGHDHVCRQLQQRPEHVGEGLGRGFSHAQTLNVVVVQPKMVAMAFKGGACQLLIHEEVIFESHVIRPIRCVVDQSAQELEGLLFR